MFPCLPTSANIVVETKFACQEAKMFPKKIWKHFYCGNNVFQFAHMFSNVSNALRFVRVNVSQQMFPSLPRA